MTKQEREEREYRSMFTDERFAKKAWRELIGKALESDACRLPTIDDGKGNLTKDSIIYSTAYRSVKTRLEEAGYTREPSHAELIVEANLIRATMDNSVFNTILDRTAGKVKDELNLSTSQFAELTDEQLELLAAHEAAKLKKGHDNNGSSE